MLCQRRENILQEGLCQVRTRTYYSVADSLNITTHNAQWENKRGQVDIHFRSQNKQFGGGFGLLCTHVYTLKQGSFNHQEY